MTTRRDLLTTAALLAPMTLFLKSAQASTEEHKERGEAHKMADFL